MTEKYLKITIHDNDFTSYAYLMADTIKNMFKWCSWRPINDKDLEKLKPAIAHVWAGFDMLHQTAIKLKDHGIYNYFMEHLKLSIEEFEVFDLKTCNFEDIYIPLFDVGEVYLK